MDISTLKHPAITAENKEAFSTHMSKFESMEHAALDGMELKKIMGKPFKMPESLDKLPDDASRTDFTSKARALLGIETAADIEGLSQLDMKLDHDDSVEQPEALTNAFKAFIVENKINKADAQKMVGFHNRTMKAAREEFAKQAEEKKIQSATATNEALIAHFKSEAEVAKQSELTLRAFQDKAGLTPDEFQKLGDALADSAFTKDPILARALMTLVAPLAAEGTNDGSNNNHNNNNNNTPPDPDEGSPTYLALGWSKAS